MKEEELKKLLEKYYSGNSTLDEEKKLRDYFSGDNILSGFETEKEIFSALAELDKAPEPSINLEDRIIKGIGGIDTRQELRIFSNRYIKFLSAAAVVLMLLGSYFLFLQKKQLKDTYSDPQIAYAETMKILNEISVKINKGTEALQPLGQMENAAKLSKETIDRSAAVISNTLKKMEPITQLSDIDYNTTKTNNK